MPSGIHTSPRGNAVLPKNLVREISQKGGYAVAIKLGDIYCQTRAERGGNAVAEKYGREYFARMAKRKIMMQRNKV